MANFTINTGVTDTTPKSVNTNDVGTIEAGGTLSAATAIIWTGGSNNPGGVINNSGAINAATRAIDTSGNFSTGSLTVNNNAGATITSANDAFRINTNVSNGTIALNNAGTARRRGPIRRSRAMWQGPAITETLVVIGPRLRGDDSGWVRAKDT